MRLYGLGITPDSLQSQGKLCNLEILSDSLKSFFVLEGLREAVNKLIFLVVGPLRGEGVKAGPLRQKTFVVCSHSIIIHILL